MPDLVAWINELVSVLKPNGQVRLAIPDKRFTFDLPRNETDLSDVLVAHLTRARVPSPREVLDHVANAGFVDCLSAWTGRTTAENAVKQYSLKGAVELAQDVLDQGTYHDVHCWVFTPKSFALLMERAVLFGLISVACAEFIDTEVHDMEFFVTMKPCGEVSQAAASWREMAARAVDRSQPTALELELAAQNDVLISQNVAICAEKDVLAAEVQNLKSQLAEVAADRAARAEQAQAIESALNAQIEHLHATVEEYKASTSWRVTAPMRALKRMFA